MEQLLIIEDDIGLNQGLSKALKADDRQIISCHELKAAREQLLCGSVSPGVCHRSYLPSVRRISHGRCNLLPTVFQKEQFIVCISGDVSSICHDSCTAAHGVLCTSYNPHAFCRLWVIDGIDISYLYELELLRLVRAGISLQYDCRSVNAGIVCNPCQRHSRRAQRM